MHICLLTLEWPPYGCGIGTYMFNLATGLVRMGHDVTVITHDKSPVPSSGVKIVGVPIPAERGRLWRKINQWRLEPYYSWSKRAYKRYQQMAKQEHFDIIETAEYGAWGRHFVGGTELPMVVKCHTPTHVVWTMNNVIEQSMKRPLWMNVLDRYEREQVVRADAIMSPSLALANYLSLNWSILRSRFIVIPNPIDTDRFCLSDHDMVAKNEILYVGRIQYNKGCFDLASAVVPLLAKHRDIKVRFVGMDMKAPEPYRRHGNMGTDVIRGIVPEQFHDRLLFTGQVPLSDVIDFQHHALCAVMPTRVFESFSYTVLEPMACGCPVVATQCGGPSEIISDGIDGMLVPPGDIEALTSSLDAMISDPERRRTLSSNARSTVEKKYSIAAIVPSIIALYESTIRKNSKVETQN